MADVKDVEQPEEWVTGEEGRYGKRHSRRPMSDTIVPTRLRPSTMRRGVIRAYRQHSEHSRQRREHDDAMALDPRFAQEHRLQVAHSIDGGRGGCPYCGD